MESGIIVGWGCHNNMVCRQGLVCASLTIRGAADIHSQSNTIYIITIGNLSEATADIKKCAKDVHVSYSDKADDECAK